MTTNASDNKPTIYTVNALAGSGKTYQAIEYALRKAEDGNKICIVQPTRDLIDQSYDDAKARCSASVAVTRFHGDCVADQSVKYSIVDYLRNPAPDGEIIFISHAAFLNLPYFDQRKNWEIICDEVPPAIGADDLNLSENHALISDDIEAKDHDPLHFLLVPKIPKRQGYLLDKIADNTNNDDVYEIIRPLVQNILSSNHRVFVKKENWERTLNRKTKKGTYKLTTHWLLKPPVFSGFKKVILMGAMLDVCAR